MNFVRSQERNSHTVAVSSSPLTHVELGSDFFLSEANTQESSMELPAAQVPLKQKAPQITWFGCKSMLWKISEASRSFQSLPETCH